MLWGLDHAHIRVHQKADGALEKVTLRDEVRVKDGHQFAVTDSQAVIQIARLGVGPFRPVSITTAEIPGQSTHLIAALVIQHPDGDVGVALLSTALQASLQYIQWFAAGGDKNVHFWIPA